jgi:hypothetical protein
MIKAGMLNKTYLHLLVALSLFIGIAVPECGAVTVSEKDFPVPVYPSHTSVFLDKAEVQPVQYNGEIETGDSIATVKAFYKAKSPAAGWTVRDTDVDTMLALEKGKGKATVSFSTGSGGKGCTIQIAAWPTGR